MPSGADERVRAYFKCRAEELRVQARYAICEHSGLIGGHREAVQRALFEHLLPRRFSVGRGMVYGAFHRSREADIVIWDSMNFPSLPMADHAMFFAEAVRLVLECKSTFSLSEFSDACLKAKSVRDIVPDFDTTPGIALRLEMLENRVMALQNDDLFLGMIQHRPHIGTGAIFLTGGGAFDFQNLGGTVLGEIDDSWPDITLLLEPGVLLCKEYQVREGFMGGSGHISKYTLKEDALLVFTSLMFRMLFDRATALEPPLDLFRYVPTLSPSVEWSLAFPLTRAVPQNHPFIHPIATRSDTSPPAT